MAKDTMTCPKCGEKMNHHADKIVYSAGAREAHAQNIFGAALEETHACPGCGAIESRLSEQTGQLRDGR